MEEEINYDVMRYEIDNEGYLTKIVFGCSTGMCQAYEGEIPEGYETLQEWYDENFETLNAWRIVSNNIVLDASKKAKLEKQFEDEKTENRNVCYKEIKNIKSIYKQDLYDMYETSTTDDGCLLELKDANKFETIKIIVKNNGSTLTNKITIRTTNANILPNDATTKNVSGISFIQNEDKTITLNGTSTAEIEYDIAGTSENINPVLTFKKNHSYNLSSNNYQIKMYYYDGTERMEVYSGSGGTISFTDGDKKVTHITLIVPNGVTIENETISLMLNKETNSNTYVTNEDDEATIDLGEQTLETNDVLLIEEGDVTLYKGSYPSEEVYYLDSIEMPVTYQDITYMYANEDVTLAATYPNTTKNLEYEGTSTANGTFSVDDEGNITATGGTIGGYTITEDGLYTEIYPKKDYTDEDLTKIRQYLMGETTLTEEETYLYDVDENGIIEMLDYVKMRNIMSTNITTEEHGSFEILNHNPVRTMLFKDKDGNIMTQIGMLGIETNGLGVNGGGVRTNHICTARLTSNYSLTASNAYETLPLEEWLTIGDKLSVNEDGNIVIGAGVNRIKINANARMTTGTGLKYLTIQNSNGQQLLQTINYKPSASGYLALSLSDAIFPVTEGETLRLRVYGASGDTIAGASQEYGMLVTYMTVEVID